MNERFEAAKLRFKTSYSKADKGFKTKCWIWNSPDPYRGGYGRVWFSGKSESAHRFSWNIHKGEIPKGIEVCHHCDIPSCVNPNHLFLGTHLDNMRDAISKNRIPFLKGELNGCAKLRSKDVLEIRLKYSLGETTYKNLALQFGVDPSMIFLIVKRKKWSHI
jgi:hypothetical protein